MNDKYYLKTCSTMNGMAFWINYGTVTWNEMIETYNRYNIKGKWPEGVEGIYYIVRLGEEKVPLVKRSEGIAIHNKTTISRNKYHKGKSEKFKNIIFPSLDNDEDIHPGIIKFNRMKRTYFGKKVSMKLRNQHAKLEILNELHERYTGFSMPLEVRRLIVKNMY